MIAYVTDDNRVVIPDEIGRRLGIRPGDRLDWEPVADSDAVLVRRVNDRGERARRLCGMGANLAPKRDLVAELVEAREREDDQRLRSFNQ